RRRFALRLLAGTEGFLGPLHRRRGGFLHFFQGGGGPGAALALPLAGLGHESSSSLPRSTMDPTRRQQNTSSRHGHIFHMTRSCTLADMVSKFTPFSESGRGPPVAQSMSSTTCTMGIVVA